MVILPLSRTARCLRAVTSLNLRVVSRKGVAPTKPQLNLPVGKTVAAATKLGKVVAGIQLRKSSM
jgi:hypothetical protein